MRVKAPREYASRNHAIRNFTNESEASRKLGRLLLFRDTAKGKVCSDDFDQANLPHRDLGACWCLRCEIHRDQGLKRHG